MTRSEAARIAALTRWSREDARAGTAKARERWARRFSVQVDPNGELDPAERSRRAHRAMRAHMLKLAVKSAKARGRGAS